MHYLARGQQCTRCATQGCSQGIADRHQSHAAEAAPHRCAQGITVWHQGQSAHDTQDADAVMADSLHPRPHCKGSNKYMRAESATHGTRATTQRQQCTDAHEHSLASELCCRGSHTNTRTRHCSLAPEPYCRGMAGITHWHHSRITEAERKAQHHKSHAAAAVRQKRMQGHLSPTPEPCCRDSNARRRPRHDSSGVRATLYPMCSSK